MILKKSIFGVDKNPMAVELAKTALWLHTFTVGAPLSFLDHHLKCGDSLHGERLDTVQRGLNALGMLFQKGELDRLDIAARSLAQVADLTDVDIAEAQLSKQLAADARDQVAPLHALLDFWRALRWRVPGWPADSAARLAALGDAPLRPALVELLSPARNLSAVLVAGHIDGGSASVAAANALLAELRALAQRERFFHWWTEFPTVFGKAGAGFDAVIGNPPWDRIKLQQVEWFAEREPNIALQARASDRKQLIADLEKKGAPLWAQYQDAAARAEANARVLGKAGDYPLLGGGDVNLYSLFVERAQALAQSDGVVALLTPSGIAADKGAAEFFRSISTTGRLGALFDFENRFNPGGSFFPDVDSRFKFCTLVFGGERRMFERARCAFYLHDIGELDDAERAMALTQEDFALVNPNTGAAPIFRTRRDAEITTRVYRANPVLVRRSELNAATNQRTEHKVWPVRYLTTFHMTNDSKLFLSRAELEQRGFVPAALNHWRCGDAEAVPLYVGRMVHHYDHRHASVTVNAKNLQNAAFGAELSNSAKADPAIYPEPQYWVGADAVPEPLRLPWAIGFRDIARATDVRTMIACIAPGTACGNTLPLLVGDGAPITARTASLLLANLNALAFDYITRQKAQTTHLNWYILEQLPVIAAERFDAPLPAPFANAMRDAGLMNGRHEHPTVADFVVPQVLALSYTAHDLAPFARDLGCVDARGQVLPPFVWNEADRRARLAALDALFMHLYGLGADDAAYILDTFPIVRQQDEAACGHYRSKAEVLARLRQMSPDAAGGSSAA